MDHRLEPFSLSISIVQQNKPQKNLDIKPHIFSYPLVAKFVDRNLLTVFRWENYRQKSVDSRTLRLLGSFFEMKLDDQVFFSKIGI
ncbi:MAG: hypothetical protein DRR19_22905 [Candidatus Parabeggiatoa sp. nov. 1]|nr:MAG: hypothetical protein DRR19_22905 [Gammaproteobacteria bacterium]